MRGKENMADAHHRSVVLRQAFEKVGLLFLNIRERRCGPQTYMKNTGKDELR